MYEQNLSPMIRNNERRNRKRKDRLEYYLTRDESTFGQFMKELDCGYTGFLLPYERHNTRKFQQFRQFEMKNFDQRQQKIRMIYSLLQEKKIAMDKWKKKLDQLFRDVEEKPDQLLVNIKTDYNEQQFYTKLMAFLNEQSCRTLNECLNKIFTSTMMMEEMEKLYEDIKKWINEITKQNQKQEINAERLLQVAEKENNPEIKLKLFTKVIRIGNEEQVIKAFFNRMINCIVNGKYLTAAQDLSILFSQVFDEKNPELDLEPQLSLALFYNGIKCYYQLVTDQRFTTKNLQQNFEKFQLLFNKLQLLSSFDYQYTNEFHSNHPLTNVNSYGTVLKQLNKEGINSKKISELRNRIKNIKKKDVEDDNTSKKDFTYSDIFDRAEFDGRYIRLCMPIKKDETIFFEQIISMSVKRFYSKKYCSFCYRRISNHFFPCNNCCESIFCDAICQRMGLNTNHKRICCLPSAFINEHFKDHIPAMVYDLFSRLPIRLVIDSSRVTTARAYDHSIKYTEKLPFNLTIFTSFMLTLPVNLIAKIDLEKEYLKNILYDSIRLSMIICYKFNLSRTQLQIIDNEELESELETGKIEDLMQLIRVVYATIYHLKHLSIGHHDILNPSYELKQDPVLIDDLGRAFGAFSSRFYPVCKSKANVQRYFQDGKIIYKALVDINSNEPLKLYNGIPEVDGEQRRKWFERFHLVPCMDCDRCKTIKEFS